MGKHKLSAELWKFIAIIVSEVVVFGLAYWIVFRFLPANEDIYNAIVIFFISGIGITVILYGNTIRNRYLNVLGFLILLYVVIIVIYRYEGLAVRVSAFATVAVAIAAFAAIEENRRIRQDSVKRESRERRERLVEEVAKWLRELWGHIFPMGSTLMSTISEMENRIKGSKGIDLKQWLKIKDLDIALVDLGNITEAMKEAEYYEKLTLQIDEGFSQLIGVVRNKLEERQKIRANDVMYRRDDMNKEKEGKSTDELTKDDNRALEKSGPSEEDIGKELDKNTNDMRESIQLAIEKAIELKAESINVS